MSLEGWGWSSGEKASWNDGSMFFFTSPVDKREIWFPLPSFHDPHAALKIRLQTQTWVTDNPDCGLLNYTILQTLKLNSTREEKTRWLCSTQFCVCGLPVNRDLGFEGKPWQLLAAAAETGECVTYRSVLSLNCCITSKWLRPQKVLMDIDGSHKHKTPPQWMNWKLSSCTFSMSVKWCELKLLNLN